MLKYTEEIIGHRVYLVFNDTYFTGCKRCGGTGHYSFDGISTVCYECGNVDSARLGLRVGTRADAVARSERLDRQQAKRDAARNKKAQEALAALEAAQAKLTEAHPEVGAFLASIDRDLERSPFLRSMADRFHSQDIVKWGFSSKQIAAVEKVIRDRQNDETAKATLGPVELGRRVIEGVVQSIKHYDGEYGLAIKMLVITTTGHKVFGTVPNALLEGRMSDDLVGQGVVFTATVEASRDDETFGIFKRPAKATLAA
uniref:DNA binding protein n=1 Tax=Micrococcus phage Olihed TaxID=3092209 RepID=A0AAU6R642_9CAUD